MREVLEEILTHHPAARQASPELPSSSVIGEIRRYAKLFWINSGPHGSITARKFVLKCTPGELTQAAHDAARHGARFPVRADETIEDCSIGCAARSSIPTVEAMVTCKTPGEGADILASSANNLYHGITMADISEFDERFGLNSRLVRSGGRARRRGLSRPWPLRRADRRHHRPPSIGRAVRHTADAQGARGVDPVLRVG